MTSFLRFATTLSLTGALLLSACATANERAMQNKAEAYIRSNIARISPKDPEFGNFRVTDIEWTDEDTARITYEDNRTKLTGTGEVTFDRDGNQVSVTIHLDQGSMNSSSASSLSSSSITSSSPQPSSSTNLSSSSTSSSSSSKMKSNEGANLGEFCGGIAAIPCKSPFTCRYEGTYPDAGGTCVRE